MVGSVGAGIYLTPKSPRKMKVGYAKECNPPTVRMTTP